MNFIRLVPIVLVLFMLVACGGGGGSSSVPEAMPEEPTPEEQAAIDARTAATKAATAATNAAATVQAAVDAATLVDTMAAQAAADAATAAATAATAAANAVDAADPATVTAANDAAMAANNAAGAANMAASALVAAEEKAQADLLVVQGNLIERAIGREPVPADIDDATTGIQFPFTVDGGKLTQNPTTDGDFLKADDLASIDGWEGAKYTRTSGAANVPKMDTVILYTDIEPPEDQFFNYYYWPDVASTRDAVDGATQGVLDIDEDGIAGFHDLFDGDFGITGPYQNIPGPVDDPDTPDVDEAMVRVVGKFNGAPGTFSCDSGCSVSSDADGNLSALGGSWLFTLAPYRERPMIIGAIPDSDYLDFGYWLRVSRNHDGTTTYAFSAFAQGNLRYNDGNGVANVEGSATYTGSATGMYMTKRYDSYSGESFPTGFGQFTAVAVLTATFGQVDDEDGIGSIAPNLLNTVIGSITDFRNDAGDMIDEKWSVSLLKGSIDTSDGTFSGMATGDGGYSGTFYGDSTDNMKPRSRPALSIVIFQAVT